MKKNALIVILFLAAGCTQFMADVTGLEFLHDRRARESILKDESIEKEAYGKISVLNELAQEARVKIEVYNAKVLVTGEAETAETRDKIIANIRVIKDIRIIYNELLVESLASKTLINNDAALSEKVSSALRGIKGYAGFDETRVKVIVSSRSVYLMGLLYANEAQTLIARIREIEGIRNIVTLFEYIEEEKGTKIKEL